MIETLASLRYGTEWYDDAEFRGFGTTSIQSMDRVRGGQWLIFFLSILPQGNRNIPIMGADGEQIQAIARMAHYRRSNVIQDGPFVKRFVGFHKSSSFGGYFPDLWRFCARNFQSIVRAPVC